MENLKSYKDKTAILVDDDADFLEILKTYISKLGFKTICADSFEEAQKLVYEAKYDLAIFDLMLENPDSGFVLSYKSKKKYPEIPVILVTNAVNETGLHFDKTNQNANSWNKADKVLDKSLRFEQLAKEINKLI